MFRVLIGIIVGCLVLLFIWLGGECFQSMCVGPRTELESTSQSNVPASRPAQDAPGLFDGTWIAEGEPVYHISQRGDSPIRIETPPNDTWRVEIKNIRLEGRSLRFEQYHYTAASPDLKSITNPTGEHPFSGVECKVTLTPDPDDRNLLHQSMATVQTPEPITGILRRQ